MRQVFTSPRLENVENLARVFEEAGIDTRIRGGRGYKGARRQTFSYREPANAGDHPSLWVLKAEDLPRAREILREAGLLTTSRPQESYLPSSAPAPALPDAGRVARRVRLGLLALIAVFTLLIVWRMLQIG